MSNIVKCSECQALIKSGSFCDESESDFIFCSPEHATIFFQKKCPHCFQMYKMGKLDLEKCDADGTCVHVDKGNTQFWHKQCYATFYRGKKVMECTESSGVRISYELEPNELMKKVIPLLRGVTYRNEFQHITIERLSEKAAYTVLYEIKKLANKTIGNPHKIAKQINKIKPKPISITTAAIFEPKKEMLALTPKEEESKGKSKYQMY